MLQCPKCIRMYTRTHASKIHIKKFHALELCEKCNGCYTTAENERRCRETSLASPPAPPAEHQCYVCDQWMMMDIGLEVYLMELHEFVNCKSYMALHENRVCEASSSTNEESANASAKGMNARFGICQQIFDKLTAGWPLARENRKIQKSCKSQSFIDQENSGKSRGILEKSCKS